MEEENQEKAELHKEAPIVKSYQPKTHYASTQSSGSSSSSLTVIVSIILILTLINSYGIFFSNPASTGGVTGNVVKEEIQPAPQVQPPEAGRVNVQIGDAPVKGDKDAPVTIIEWSDYECPFCSRFYSDTLKQIEEQYIKTGKVKFAYKDFPLSFHPNAQKSAEAAKCVRDELGDDGYWAFHDKIFENQGSLSPDSLKVWSKEVGANSAKFDSCLSSGKFAAKVQSEFREGQTAGVQGTPAFFINGKLISGAQPFPAFQSAIEEELRG